MNIIFNLDYITKNLMYASYDEHTDNTAIKLKDGLNLVLPGDQIPDIASYASKLDMECIVEGDYNEKDINVKEKKEPRRTAAPKTAEKKEPVNNKSYNSGKEFIQLVHEIINDDDFKTYLGCLK